MNQKRALQMIWIKAAKGVVSIPIVLPTEAAALQFRLSLYRAVQGVRKHAQLDPELFEAVNLCSVVVDGQDRTKLWVGPGIVQGLLADVMAQVGITQEELRPAGEIAAEASLKKFESLLDEPVVEEGRKANPYYKRD